jgi:uncharacterized membrane protein YfcA
MALKIPEDKRKHLKGGAAIAGVLLVVALLALYVSLAAAVAAGSVALSIGVELYQRWRKEGEPSWPDAITSSLPGLVLAGGLVRVRGVATER